MPTIIEPIDSEYVRELIASVPKEEGVHKSRALKDVSDSLEFFQGDITYTRPVTIAQPMVVEPDDMDLERETKLIDFSDNQGITGLNEIDSHVMKAIIKGLERNSDIVSVSFESTQLSDEAVDVLCEHLESGACVIDELNLNESGLLDGSIVRLSRALESNFSITFLDLSNNQFSDNSARALARGLAQNEDLEHLSINGVSYDSICSSDSVVEIVRAFAGTDESNISRQGTRVLEASCNDIDDKGAVEISRILKSDNLLKSLDISYNDFGNIGASLLANSLKSNSTLAELDIKDNDIGDNALEMFTDMLTVNKTLQRISLTPDVSDLGILGEQEAYSYRLMKSVEEMARSDRSVSSNGQLWQNRENIPRPRGYAMGSEAELNRYF